MSTPITPTDDLHGKLRTAAVEAAAARLDLDRWEADGDGDYFEIAGRVARAESRLHAADRAVKMSVPSYTPQSLFTRDLYAQSRRTA